MILPKIAIFMLVVLIAYGIFFQPTWATRPIASAIETILQYLGAGVLPTLGWTLVFLTVWRYRPGLLFRKWRFVLGSAILVIASLGILAYFEGQLPYNDRNSNLGGIYGLKVQGDTISLSFLRMGAITIFGLWVLDPSRTPKVMKFLLTIPVRGWFISLFIGRTIARAVQWIRSYFDSVTHKYPRESQDKNQPIGPADDDETSNSGNPFSKKDPESSAVPPHESDLVDNTATASPMAQKEVSHRKRKGSQSSWRLPPVSILDSIVPTTTIGDEHKATATLIEETLGDHGVEVRVAEIRPGPTVTMFGLVPGWNRRNRGVARAGEESAENPARNRVKVDSILAREKDLALALAAPSLRIEAPVPGESVVGVEVPNSISSTVVIRPVMESEHYQDILNTGGLPIALGQASAGESASVDLLTMPHLLIAGATGSGKSVCMNAVIASIITHQLPDSVRLLLIDPKRVELTPYNGVPHLVTPVVVEPDRVIRLLRGAIQEMIRRYRLLEEAGVRNVQSYNTSPKATEHIPYLIICIDELADLMMTSAFDVEQSICRLAQLGRATGIHLVVATQRPSVDVVTGLIKANFPSRISFAVASQVDSRTILDAAGAEKLLGKGDMLFLSPEAAKPRRIQGVFISEEESSGLADHWRNQDRIPVPEIPLEELAREAIAASQSNLDNHGRDDDDDDAIYHKALGLASTSRALSTSLLQRRLRIGYPRAARLMDQLEDEGVVAPSAEPGKPREVLYIPSDER